MVLRDYPRTAGLLWYYVICAVKVPYMSDYAFTAALSRAGLHNVRKSQALLLAFAGQVTSITDDAAPLLEISHKQESVRNCQLWS